VAQEKDSKNINEDKQEEKTEKKEETVEKESEKKEETSEEKPKKRKKFVFECTECGACCKRSFPIYYEDLKRWNLDQTFPRVFPHLQIELIPPAGFQISFKKVKNDAGEEVCPFYTPNSNNRCGLFFSKPISCIAFPLGYDKSTNRYYIIDKSCEGLGKGTMTREYLRQMRENSQLDYECRIRTSNTLPILQILFMQFFNQQSQEVMESLSPEDREQLEKILAKSKGGDKDVAQNETKEDK